MVCGSLTDFLGTCEMTVARLVFDANPLTFGGRLVRSRAEFTVASALAEEEVRRAYRLFLPTIDWFTAREFSFVGSDFCLLSASDRLVGFTPSAFFAGFDCFCSFKLDYYGLRASKVLK